MGPWINFKIYKVNCNNLILSKLSNLEQKIGDLRKQVNDPNTDIGGLADLLFQISELTNQAQASLIEEGPTPLKGNYPLADKIQNLRNSNQELARTNPEKAVEFAQQIDGLEKTLQNPSISQMQIMQCDMEYYQIATQIAMWRVR